MKNQWYPLKEGQPERKQQKLENEIKLNEVHLLRNLPEDAKGVRIGKEEKSKKESQKI